MSDNPLDRIEKRSAQEPYAKLLGIEVLEIRPGYARVAMRFTPEMQNIFGMLHGGAVFSLLDEAFQLACNARGEVAVAQQVNIYFLAPASAGARLVAEAKELHATRKTAVFDICVYEDGDGEKPGRKLAAAQALAHRKGGQLPLDEHGNLQQ